MTETQQDKLLDKAEACKLLGITEETLTEYVKDGMPCMRLGEGNLARYRFLRAEILTWARLCARRQAKEAK